MLFKKKMLIYFMQKKNLSAGIPHFLSYIKEILKSKGFVVLLTGNNNSIPAKIFKNNWWYLRFSEHIVFPSIKYLSQLNDFILQEHQNTYAFKSNEKINF